MGRAGRKRKAGEREKDNIRGPFQRLIDRERVQAEQSILAVITPEQRAKGTYDGERRIVNRGGTPVMRWLHAGKLNETQALAIQTCHRLWAICGTEQRTTAAYGETVAGATEESDYRVSLALDAQEDLRRIQGYIPRAYWDTFENVCRWNEPAGVAGSRMGSTRGAEDRAHTIVCFVADVIAMYERLIPVTRIIAA